MAQEEQITLDQLNPLNELLGVVLSAIEEWKANNTPPQLTSRVHQILDKNSKEIVLKLLGFNSNWGSWELDHCNGRAGESAAGDYLRQVQKKAIDEWLSSVKLPPMESTVTESMINDCKAEYRRFLDLYLREYAQSEADKHAKEIISSLFSTSKADGMMKLQSLLQGNKE